MPRTYADNSFNRSLGRVGMTHGSAVYSASTGTVSNRSASTSFGSSVGSSSSYTSGSSYNGASSSSYPKTYVDNSLNRSLGRVGLEHGSATYSPNSRRPPPPVSSSSSKTYADNSLNRSLGRVGLEHGSAVYNSQTGEIANRNSSSGVSKTYVDNPQNRKLGRVGLEHGTAVKSKTTSVSETRNVKTTQDSHENQKFDSTSHQPLYKTLPPSKSQSKVYVDNQFNRKHNRVGKPLGSQPISKTLTGFKPVDTSTTEITSPRNGQWDLQTVVDWYNFLYQNTKLPNGLEEKLNDDQIEDFRQAKYLTNREQVAVDYTEACATDDHWSAQSHISQHLLTKLKGRTINFKDLELGVEIGQGGFGTVYFATLDEQGVAVKKLKVQELTKKRMKQFEDEISLFCNLNHPNILKFVGACLEKNNLSIVMEFMEMSLYEALHIKEIDFPEGTKKQVMRDLSSGLQYLHTEDIAHCDIKTQNILLNNIPGQDIADESKPMVVKISDFGLSLLKADTETSVSGIEVGVVGKGGSPRYSAPECLRGEERLSVEKWKLADVYSMGLCLYELVVGGIPFEDFTLPQLIHAKGKKGETPTLPTNIHRRMKQVLVDCWQFDADQRPSAAKLRNVVDTIVSIYPVEE